MNRCFSPHTGNEGPSFFRDIVAILPFTFHLALLGWRSVLKKNPVLHLVAIRFSPTRPYLQTLVTLLQKSHPAHLGMPKSRNGKSPWISSWRLMSWDFLQVLLGTTTRCLPAVRESDGNMASRSWQ